VTIYFTVPGPPVGKARPKVVRAKNGMNMTYTPDKTVAYEELVRLRFNESLQGCPCIRHFGRNCVWNRGNQCPGFEPESVERSDKLPKKAEFPNDTKQICLSRKLP